MTKPLEIKQPEEPVSTFVGIDLGKTGGIVALNGGNEIAGMWPMPMLGREYDLKELLGLLRQFDPMETQVVVERIHALPAKMGGGLANFSRGFAMGMIESVLTAARLAYQLATPQKWQKKVIGPFGQGESKAAAVIAARRLWPDQSWVLVGRRKESDGLIDAALIAHYCRSIWH